MSSEAEQIKLSFEQLGMTPEEIAGDRGLEIDVVKATLASVSAKYRRACGEEGEEKNDLNFTDEQEERIRSRIYEIAVGSDNDAVALKACMYIRDDKKGRLDTVKQLAGITFNVLQLNDQMKKANAAVEEALKQQKVIDVK